MTYWNYPADREDHRDRITVEVTVQEQSAGAFLCKHPKRTSLFSIPTRLARIERYCPAGVRVLSMPRWLAQSKGIV
jgi:hypothetical protein